jgi:large subunit ribosomal protein L10
MPKTRSEKAEIIDQIGEKLDEYPIVYLTNFAGLTVAQSNELRIRFREAGVEYQVTKNTLARMALDRLDGLDALEEYFTGPTAIAFSDDPAKPARVIEDFLEEEDADRPELKVAWIEGELYEGHDALDTLADLKSREELVGDIVGLLLAPAQNIAGALQGQGQKLAGIVKALAERDEDEVPGAAADRADEADASEDTGAGDADASEADADEAAEADGAAGSADAEASADAGEADADAGDSDSGDADAEDEDEEGEAEADEEADASDDDASDEDEADDEADDDASDEDEADEDGGK